MLAEGRFIGEDLTNINTCDLLHSLIQEKVAFFDLLDDLREKLVASSDYLAKSFAVVVVIDSRTDRDRWGLPILLELSVELIEGLGSDVAVGARIVRFLGAVSSTAEKPLLSKITQG